jgi:GNAT superfamily N-acetyltransferase
MKLSEWQALMMIDLKEIKIIKAGETDTTALTEISFAAKRHWKYPEYYYDLWKNELTLTVDYLNVNVVYKAVYQHLILGFYSIVENKADYYAGEVLIKKGFWLDHVFVRPAFHGMGIGRLLIEHARMISESKGISHLLIFADPNSKEFYDKIGARYLHDSKSSIPGRLLPVYELKTGC